MNKKQLKAVAKKIDSATIVTLLATEMEDQGVAVTENNIAKIYIHLLGKVPDVSRELIETMLDQKLLRSSW